MIKISAVLLLCFSFGIAQSSANLLSTLKIYGGLGIYQMNTPTHLLHLLKDNGFSSTTITPHPIYIEERRDYPFYRNIPLENGFFQLEIEFSKSIVGGIGVQNDRYGTVNGRTPEKHFAILDYKVTSRYFYSGLMQSAGPFVTIRGSGGISINDISYLLDARNGLPPTDIANSSVGIILMAGLDYTLSQLAAIGIAVRYNLIPEIQIPKSKW